METGQEGPPRPKRQESPEPRLVLAEQPERVPPPGPMQPPVAFVLGGGGVRGAAHLGMLRALVTAGIKPDLIVGTSIGAVAGAAFAAEPSLTTIERLLALWTSPEAEALYDDGLIKQMRRLAVSRTHLASRGTLRRLVAESIGPFHTFEDLAVPLRVIAASIERAAEHCFCEGPLIDAVVASASVPGLFPPMQIDGEHYIDGGIVNSIPIEEAVRQGMRTVFVLQVGRVEEELQKPRHALDAARVAFEVARRHRFARDMANTPPGVTLHVLPSGGAEPGDERLMSFRDVSATRRRADRAYQAARSYLSAQVLS